MDLNDSQRKVFLFIKDYASQYKTPVPRRKIAVNVDVNPNMLPHYLTNLIKKGYIRRSATGETCYIVLRTI